METFDQRFSGISSLLGENSLQILKNSHFLVVGLGGVGSWCVEALARSGVGKLTLIDLDDICTTNTNRQLPAHDGNYGKYKAEVLRDRVLAINPECKVSIILSYLTEKNVDEVFAQSFDYVLDAIDSVKDKCMLINTCYQKNIPIVCAGGSAGKKNPLKITTGELAKTRYDYLLKNVRKKLKNDYRYPLGRGRAKVQCVFSDEHPVKPLICETQGACDGGLGTSTYMTGTFAFFLVYLAISDRISQVN